MLTIAIAYNLGIVCASFYLQSYVTDDVVDDDGDDDDDDDDGNGDGNGDGDEDEDENDNSGWRVFSNLMVLF